jgi:hypothetical protein
MRRRAGMEAEAMEVSGMEAMEVSGMEATTGGIKATTDGMEAHG